MKKRLLALLLATLMMLAFVVGCAPAEDVSSDAPASSDEPADSSEDATDDAMELEEATVQMWLLGPGKQADADMVWEEWNTLLQDYVPNTTVEWNVVASEEYKDAYTRMLAAGEPVDMAWTGYLTNLQNDIVDGNMQPLDDLLAEYGPNITPALGDAMEGTRHSDGNLYYIYAWQGVVGSPTAIYIPTELATLGSETWPAEMQEIADVVAADPSLENLQSYYDKFGEVMPAIMEADRLYGGIDYRNQTSFTFSYGGQTSGVTGAKDGLSLNGVGFYYNDDTFTVTDIYNSDEVKLKYENIANFYDLGYYRSDIGSLTQTWLNADGSWGADDQIVFAHNAYGDDAAGDRSAIQGRPMEAIRNYDMFWIEKQTSGMGVPYSADEPERAMMVLDALFANADLYQMLIYGIEGTHYTDNGDGTYFTEYGSQGRAEDAYGLWKWTIGTCMNSLVTPGVTEGYYERQKELEADAYLHPLMNFVLDRSEIDDIILAVNTVDLEYRALLENGVMGSAGWEATHTEWMAEREAAGVNDLIAEYQAQIDEFVAANGITGWDYTYTPAAR